MENETEVVAQEATPQAEAPQADVSGDTATEIARLQKEITDLRRENAKRRTDDKKVERQAMEEAGQFKTLYEQAQTRITELEAVETQRQRAALLDRVVKVAGLTPDLADRLRGETEDELLADAKALAKHLVNQATVAPSTGATNPGRGTPAARKKTGGIRY